MTPTTSGGVDIWGDLLIACLVVFVVLAPAFIFRLPADEETPQAAKTSARASIYYHGRSKTADSGTAKTTYRRQRAEVQQRPSGVREPDVATKASKSSKSAAAAPPIRQKKAL